MRLHQQLQYSENMLDQIIGSNFKSKTANAEKTTEDFVDEAMHAKISVQADGALSSDDRVIQRHLQQYSNGDAHPEQGSSILYGAIHDLDLSEVEIPEF